MYKVSKGCFEYKLVFDIAEADTLNRSDIRVLGLVHVPWNMIATYTRMLVSVLSCGWWCRVMVVVYQPCVCIILEISCHLSDEAINNFHIMA